MNHTVFQGRAIQAEEKANAKALGQECAWHDQYKYREARVRRV